MNHWCFACRQNQKADIVGRRAASVFSGMAALVSLLTLFASPASAIGAVRKQADFNGDGYADLAVGAPGEDFGYYMPTGATMMIDAGFVQVTYGASSGLDTYHGQVLTRGYVANTSPYRPAHYANFGKVMAWGDFNRDGYDDLAVSALNDAGCVDIHYGSRSGLSYTAAQRITSDQIRAGFPPRAGDGFGSALAVGDVNGDGYADLAISQSTGAGGRGMVFVISGSAFGLQTASGQLLFYFGSTGPFSLAMGDFNGDKFFDLAMGLPYAPVGKVISAGQVMVAYGTPYGLDSNPQIWDQNSDGIAGICERGDQFGYSLAAADFNDDGKWDLAVGSPGENTNAGIAHIIFGQATGLDSWASQIWSQDDPNVYETSEANDRFGECLVAMHMESDRFPELVVGIPGENSGAGAVQVLTIVQGYLGLRHAFWNQDSYQIQGGCEPGDRFGSSLVAGDFNGNKIADLAIGVVGENSGAGAVNVLYGAGSGLSWPGNQILMQGFQGTYDTQENGDRYGTL